MGNKITYLLFVNLNSTVLFSNLVQDTIANTFPGKLGEIDGENFFVNGPHHVDPFSPAASMFALMRIYIMVMQGLVPQLYNCSCEKAGGVSSEDSSCSIARGPPHEWNPQIDHTSSRRCQIGGQCYK